jgi:hypothetical protein
MRVFAAVVLAALASAAGAQAAMFPPPVALHKLPLIQLERAKPHASTVSCTAHTRAKIGRTQRRLVPVACEQPPRSKLLDSTVAILLTP